MEPRVLHIPGQGLSHIHSLPPPFLFSKGEKLKCFFFGQSFIYLAEGREGNKDRKILTPRFPKSKQSSQVTVEEAWNCRRNSKIP